MGGGFSGCDTAFAELSPLYHFEFLFEPFIPYARNPCREISIGDAGQFSLDLVKAHRIDADDAFIIKDIRFVELFVVGASWVLGRCRECPRGDRILDLAQLAGQKCCEYLRKTIGSRLDVDSKFSVYVGESCKIGALP